MKYVDLSPSERRILILASQGFSAKKMGEDLHVSISTVRNQLKQARAKLDAKNTSHAVALAFRQGLIE